MGMKQELVALSDEVWERMRTRFDGLTDDEYLWEPAPGCWSIRQDDAGRWRTDWPLPRPTPEPFTTIAWRLWHLIDMYGEDRAARWFDVEPHGDPIGLDDPAATPPPTAAEALALLSRAHDRWDAHLSMVSEERLLEPVGAVGGQHADRARMAHAFHMLDEFIHHAAEISMLRDLWRWQHPLGVETLVERAMRGDLTVADGLPSLDPTTAAELVRVAAAYARWDLLTALVSAGASVPSDGTSPLHVAAGAGELAVVQLLVAHGADVEAKDPEFDAVPLDWARFLNKPKVARWLESLV